MIHGVNTQHQNHEEHQHHLANTEHQDQDHAYKKDTQERQEGEYSIAISLLC